jgi:hypothetical protein
MGSFILILLGLLTFGNPVLLVVIAAIRIVRTKTPEPPAWRSVAFWVALLFAGCAVVSFWIAIAYAPTAAKSNAFVYQRLWKTSNLTAVAALVGSLAAKGRGRLWVAFSSAITPLSWFWVYTIQ